MRKTGETPMIGRASSLLAGIVLAASAAALWAPEAVSGTDICSPGYSASQRLPAVGPWITQNSAPTGSVARISCHRVKASQPQRSMPTSRRRPSQRCRTYSRAGS